MSCIFLQQGSPEWLQFRQKGIGGSDAAAALGISPYKSNIELWEEKTGRREPTDISGKPYVQYGTDAEDPLRRLFALDFPQYTVLQQKTEVYQKGFMFASLDARLASKEEGLGILEIKTSELHSKIAAEKWDKQVPQHYYVQILHYMYVLNAAYAFLKVQIKSAGANGLIEHITRHYKFLKQDVLGDVKYLITKEREFWGYVERDERPPVILPEI